MNTKTVQQVGLVILAFITLSIMGYLSSSEFKEMQKSNAAKIKAKNSDTVHGYIKPMWVGEQETNYRIDCRDIDQDILFNKK